MTQYKQEIQPGLFIIGSLFGRILTGRLSENSHQDHLSLLQLCTGTKNRPDSQLDQFTSWDNFWKLETIGITNDGRNDDEIANDMFQENIDFHNQRYQVAWPWRGRVTTGPENGGRWPTHRRRCT